MRLSDLSLAAVSGITANVTRTLLTTLGIVIGVAAVVLMISAGRSLQNYILEQVSSFGTNTMDVFPTGFEKFGGNLDSLTEDDAEAIAKLSTVESVVPVIIVGKPIEFQGERWSPMIMGATPGIFENYHLTLDRGRLLSDGDNRGSKPVAVLASKTAEDLFGDKDPLGERIVIGNVPFTVVGVLRKLGSVLLQSLDTHVYVPYETARSLTGRNHLSYIPLKTVGDPALATRDITMLLRERHRIDNPDNDTDKDDFRARSAEQISGIINTVTLGLTVFLSLVAAIALLVGGIGIMNIMLVSVSERTKEIGLRKAIGAKQSDILLQFLLEAVLLTVLGGLIGVLLGGGTGWFLSKIADKFLGGFGFVLSFSSIALALFMAGGTGLLFGIYPARKASKLSPMEAIRWE